MPSSRCGTFETSIASPISLRAAISTAADVMPAAPQSCIPTTHGSFAASKHASISTFSKKGFPTCTAERISACSAKVRLASPDAP